MHSSPGVPRAEVARPRSDAEIARPRERATPPELDCALFFEMAAVGFLVTDQSGMIRLVNPAAAELLRRPPAMVTGKPLALWVPLRERAAFRTALQRVASSRAGEAEEWALRLQTARSAAVDVAAVVSAPRVSGEVRAIQWILREQRAVCDGDIL